MNNEEMIVDKAVEKPFTLRPLCDEDLYPILDIIGKVCPEEIRPIFNKVLIKYDGLSVISGENMKPEDKQEIVNSLAEEVGIDIIMDLGLIIIRNLKTVKDDVYALLSDLSGIPAEQIRKMPFGTTPKMIMDVVRDVRNTDFFGE